MCDNELSDNQNNIMEVIANFNYDFSLYSDCQLVRVNVKCVGTNLPPKT